MNIDGNEVEGKFKLLHFSVKSDLESFAHWLGRYTFFTEEGKPSLDFFLGDERYTVGRANMIIEGDTARGDMFVEEWDKGYTPPLQNAPSVINFSMRKNDIWIEVNIKYLDIPQIPEIPIWIDRIPVKIELYWDYSDRSPFVLST
jgi:hypothetical protein